MISIIYNYKKTIGGNELLYIKQVKCTFSFVYIFKVEG